LVIGNTFKKGVILKNKIRVSILLIDFLFIILVSGCSVSRTLVYITPDKIDSNLMVFSQSNIILMDASVLHCPYGFKYENDTIKAFAEITTLINGKIDGLNFYAVPIDSVAAIKYYKPYGSAGNAFGNVLLSLSVPFLPFSISCIIDPKSCFGSCPTVYTYSGKEGTMEAELFSASISSLLESKDLDLLKEIPQNDKYKLTITNEALESHYINYFKVVAVYNCDTNTRLMVSSDGKIVPVTKFPVKVNYAVNSDDIDVTHLVDKSDEIYYRSGMDKFRKIGKGQIYDNIIVKYRPKANTDSLYLIVKSRNTLLSTTLLYDVVLGSQGVSAVDWYYKMTTDSSYAGFFKKLYDEFSGIKIYKKLNDSWEYIDKIGDGGPINWKEYAVAIKSKTVNPREIELKLEFISDNFMIDYIAFDESFINSNCLAFEALKPEITSTNLKQGLDEILSFVNSPDNNYLVTEPGDYLDLTYNVSNYSGKQATFVIESAGYYTEWIRGSWIKNANGAYKFNLFDIRGTLTALVKSWEAKKEQLEEVFFKTKIPVRR
jgi:hypothetical protein